MITIRFGIRRGEKLIAHENGISTRKKAQSLRFVGERESSRTHADDGCWHQDARGGDGAYEFQRIDFRFVCEWSSRNSNQHVDGNALWMWPLRRKLFKEPAPPRTALAHP